MSTDTKIGTLSGTLLAVFCSIDMGELIRSCIVAATGAAVSFTISLLCKWAWRKIQARRKH